jgi:2-keto-4-pentenoate hydratase
MSDWPQKFLHAYSERHHYDSVSAAHDELTLDDAYDIQHQFVALRKEAISGYKAALTAPAAQQAMGINTAIIGALFAVGEFDATQTIVPNGAALLETELGYRVNDAISAPVNADDVARLLHCCMPMIELASPNLSSKPNGLDLIATNAASYGYICGVEGDLDAKALDALQVSLRQGDEIKLQGVGAEVLGGQLHALAWLINQTLARGYQIEAGHLFMTGSIGGMCAAAPGNYVAEFGALGKIEFSIGES